MKGTKRIAAVVLLVLFGASLFGTGMPVIDVAAIAQAIQEAVSEVNRWNTRLRQWQSEYDRVKKAAEKITSGDFTQVVGGLASLTGQMAGWADGLDWSGTSDWLESASDGSYSLLSMVSNAKLFLANQDRIIDVLQTNIEKAQDKSNVVEAGLDGTFALGSATIGSLQNILNRGGGALLSGLQMTNDVLDLLKVSPLVYAQIYEENMEDGLQKAGFSSFSDLTGKISDLEGEKSKQLQELQNISQSETPDMYSQVKAAIDSLDNEISNLKELKAWYLDMQNKLAEVKGGQKAYEAQAKENADAEADGESRQDFMSSAIRADMEGDAKMQEAIDAMNGRRNSE